MSIYLRGSNWYISVTHKGKRFRAALDTTDQAEAERRAAEIEAQMSGAEPPSGEALCDARWINDRMCAMRYRSKGGDTPCMTKEDLQEIVRRAGGRCEVTGLPFSSERPRDCRRAPFAPSVDRIDARKGYSAANCRLVCFAVNVALNQWGEATFRRMALAILSKPRHISTPQSA